MVIKTEVCAFSDTRIYPGHGVRFIRRDGQVRDATPNPGTSSTLQLFTMKCLSLEGDGAKAGGVGETESHRQKGCLVGVCSGK